MIAVLFAVCFIAVEAEFVMVRDLTADQDKRNLDGGLPEFAKFQLNHDGGELVLNFRENKRLNADADFYDINIDEFGKLHTRKMARKEGSPRSRFYQDLENFAYVMIKCERNVFGPCTRTLSGNILLEGREHSLRPADTGADRRTIDELLVGTPHILELLAPKYADLEGGALVDSVTPPDGYAKSRDSDTSDSDELDQSEESKQESILKAILERMKQNTDNDNENQSPTGSHSARLVLDELLRRQRLDGMENDDVDDDDEEDEDLDEDDTLTEYEVAQEKVVFDRVLRKMKEGHRQKREATVYTVETFIMIDYAAYLKFVNSEFKSDDIENDIREYYSHAMNGVDYKYKTIDDPNYAFGVTIAGFGIADSVDKSPWTGQPDTFVDAYSALSSFNTAVNGNASLTQIDHAVLITGNDIYYSGSTSVIGLAFTSGICGSYRTQISEMLNLYRDPNVLSHELGHNLGMGHDSAVPGCAATDAYVMAPSSSASLFSSASKNQWRFSPCSIQELKDTVDSYGSCLLNPGRIWDAEEWANITALLPGQRFTLDEQCKFAAGDGYTHRPGLENSSFVCRNLQCIDDSSQYGIYVAAEGTPCGYGKWCIEAECVNNVYQCVDKGVQGMDCSALQILMGNKLCRDLSHLCCATCQPQCSMDRKIKGASKFKCQDFFEMVGGEVACAVFPYACCKSCDTFFKSYILKTSRASDVRR